jgi:MFS family permease
MEKGRAKIFYGYVVVAASFAIMTVAWGANRTFGIFLDPMVKEFGWTRAGFSGAFTLGMINLGLVSLLAGRLADQFGPRALLIACSFFLGVGYVLSSQIGNLWHLYLFYGVFTGIGMSGAWAPTMSVVTRWFVKNRSLMSGLIAAGPAIGIAVFPPLFGLLLELCGWRLSFLFLGVLSFLVIFLAALFLKRDPAEIGAFPFGAGPSSVPERRFQEAGISFGMAVRSQTFWLLLIISFCDFMLINVVAVHIVPHAIQLEIPPIQATTVLSLAAGVSIPGRILVGALADRIGNRPGFYVCLTLSVAAFLTLQFSQTLGMLYFFAVLYGLGLWSTGAILSPYLADLFGLKSHGSIFAGMVFSGTLGGGLGPMLVGYTFDLTGSYRLGFQICLFASIAAWVALGLVRPTRSK